MKSKKLLTSVVALGTAAALALGGTLAWQSIDQTALNEASDIVNPGGRLHNDLYYVDAMKTDANIYVENFADDDIYARVRLSEYMEIVMNYGTDVARVETVAGSKTSTDDPNGEKPTQKDTYDFTYAVHKFGTDAENATADYFEWTTGNENTADYYYMPTFNRNKDSLKADLHGLYVDRVGGISSRGDEQYTVEPWAESDTREGFEIYDGDYNTVDELKDLSVDDMEQLIEGGKKAFRDQTVLDAVKLVEAAGDDAHKATTVGTTKGLISMQEWLDLVDENGYAEDGKLTVDGKTAMYGYWVYDTDGWVYWSAPIAGGETTGLLLDGFDLNHIMDDTWYYAIEAEAQFVTANDVGKADKTGFYSTADSGVDAVDDTETETTVPVTEEAETLLKLIGVDFGEAEEEDTDDTPVLKMQDMATYTMTSTVAYISVDSGETFRVKNTDGSTPSEESMTVSTRGGTIQLEADIDYTYENGLLTITSYDSAEWLNENGTALQVGANDFDTNANGVAQIIFGDDGKLTMNTVNDSAYGADITVAPLNKGVTVETAEGAAPTSVEVAYEYESDNGGYTYADGMLTITNEDYVGKVLKVYNNGGEGYGFVLVTDASDTGDTGDDGDDDEVVDTSPILTLKATTLPEVSFVSSFETSGGKGIRILDQNGQPVAADDLIVMHGGKEYTVYEEKAEGVWCTYKDGKLRLYDDLNDQGGFYPDDFAVVKIKGTDQFGCLPLLPSYDKYPYYTENKDENVSELSATSSRENVFKVVVYDEDLTIVPVKSLDETLTSNANEALQKGTDYTVTYETGNSGNKLAVVTIDARYAGQMLKTYSVMSDGTYAANVIFVDPDITESIVPTTPDDPVDEETAEEIVRTDAQEEGLKVTYKRKANAVYMAGSGACEFKLKPEYNSSVLTDTGMLTLTVNVDSEDKAAITGSSFEASAEDGDGWLKCTVSDLFTDKTDDVIVKLTVTYKNGDIDLTTEAYTITFTKGGTVS